MSKYRMMSRIIKPNGKSIIVAMDHAQTDGPQTGYVNPAETINTMVEGGADAILATYGMIKNFEKELAPVGLIMRLDYPASAMLNDVHLCQIMYQVESACRMGADAVILNAGPGEKEMERLSFNAMAAVAEECDKVGMPLIAEMVPGGYNAPAELTNLEFLTISARIAGELGADMIKMAYRPGFEKVVAGTYLPIFVLGGAKTNDEQKFMENIEDAMRCGARGVAIGRNIWGHSNPKGVLATLRAIVHDGADAATAIKNLK